MSRDATTQEVLRLRAENARLKKLLAKAEDMGPWGQALLDEVRDEERVADERRLFCLQSELALAIRRRQRLESAARAQHAGLERLEGLTPAQAAQRLEAMLADGAAVAASEEEAAGQPHAAGNTLPADVTMEAAFEAEQQLVSLAKMLKGKSFPRVDAVSLAKAESSLEALIPELTLQGVRLPPAKAPQRAAAVRRRLGRLSQPQESKAGASAAEGSPAEGLRREAADLLDLPNHPLGPSATHLPEGLLLAWEETLEAASAERSVCGEVQQVVSDMAGAAAAWALRLQIAKLALAKARPLPKAQGRARGAT